MDYSAEEDALMLISRNVQAYVDKNSFPNSKIHAR